MGEASRLLVASPRPRPMEVFFLILSSSLIGSGAPYSFIFYSFILFHFSSLFFNGCYSAMPALGQSLLLVVLMFCQFYFQKKKSCGIISVTCVYYTLHHGIVYCIRLFTAVCCCTCLVLHCGILHQHLGVCPCIFFSILYCYPPFIMLQHSTHGT